MVECSSVHETQDLVARREKGNTCGAQAINLTEMSIVSKNTLVCRVLTLANQTYISVYISPQNNKM